MARDSIIQKLREELLLPLRRESQVVYLMAEIRKYLDHRKTNEQADWRVLSFFCNWALHIRIDRTPSGWQYSYVPRCVRYEDWFQHERISTGRLLQRNNAPASSTERIETLFHDECFAKLYDGRPNRVASLHVLRHRRCCGNSLGIQQGRFIAGRGSLVNSPSPRRQSVRHKPCSMERQTQEWGPLFR